MNHIKVTLAVMALLLSFCGCYAKEPQKAGLQSNQAVEKSSEDESILYSSRASNRFMQRDLNGAINELSQAINLNPNNPMHYLNRGYVKHVLMDYKGAMEDYNSALKVNPNFAQAYNNRGVLKVAMNDTKGAFEDYEKALSLNAKYADVYYNRGNLRYMTNDNEGALKDYDLAIKYNPKDSDAYNNRGVVKKRMNYNVGALSDYSQAIALNPKDSIAYANRGHLKKLYFDNEGAAIDLDQAVKLAENQVFLKNVKPLLSKEHYIAAIPVVSGVTDNLPVNPREEKIALIAKKPKDITPAVEKTSLPKADGTLTAMAAKKDTNKLASASAGTVLKAGVGKVKMETPPDIRTKTVATSPTTNVKLAESYYIRGLQKCVLRDLQGAKADLDKAIANNSKYADALFYRGAIKKELGDIEGFKADYAAAIQINPSLQAFNDSNALALIR